MSVPNFDALSIQHSLNIKDPVTAAATDGKRWSSAKRDYHLNTAIRKWLLKQMKVKNSVALAGYINEESQSLSGNVKALSTWTNYGVGIISAYDATTSLPMPELPQEMRVWANSGGNTLLTASATNPYFVLDGSNFRGLGCAATDSVTLRYVKSHTDIVANSGSVAVVSDTSWSATTTAVTGFTGTIASHVGGQFVGTDNGGNFFTRTIVAYVSATAFTINAALTADGAGTNGYIIPKQVSDIAVPSQYWHQILMLAFAVAKSEVPTADDLQIALNQESMVDKEIGLG